MNRVTIVAAPWTTLEIRDEPSWLNRLLSPGVIGEAVKYRGKQGRRREQSCLHRDGVGAIPAHSGNILVSTVITVRFHCLRIYNKMQNLEKMCLARGYSSNNEIKMKSHSCCP